jgi:hypothetical protein
MYRDDFLFIMIINTCGSISVLGITFIFRNGTSDPPQLGWVGSTIPNYYNT